MLHCFLLCVLMPYLAWSQNVRFSILKTGTAETREGLVFQGGSFFKKIRINHSAILIQHDDKLILFDSGLGSQIKEQYGDMLFGARPLFSFTDVHPASSQLTEEERHHVSRTILSHVHWDHASGLRDFPQACVAISPDEAYELQHIVQNATFPSSFNYPEIKWCLFRWSPQRYKSFDKSFDLFGDGSAVLVPLPGHTTGSVGLFLKTATREFLFVGDLTWSRRGLLEGKGRFWAASWLVDRNRQQTAESLLKVKSLAQTEPGLVVIPAHDAQAQDELGYYPNWVEN